MYNFRVNKKNLARTARQLLQWWNAFSRTKWTIVLLLAPAAALIILLSIFAVNVPFWDQWELIELYKRAHDGTLTFWDLFAQHNEHRILFGRLVFLGLANLSNWNTLYEVGASVIFALGSFGLLWTMLKKTFQSRPVLIAAAFVVSFILFSPLQSENWIWGWQLMWFMNVLAVVTAIWALGFWQAPAIARLIVAILAGIVATYSLASGAFVWLVCVPLLLFNKKMRRFLPLWLFAAALVVGSHYWHYVDPAYHPSKTLFLSQPLNFTIYLLAYLGRPVVVDFLLSVPITLLYLGTLAVSLAHVYKKHVAHLTTTFLPWLCLGGYAVLAALSASVSRLGLGIEQAFSSRYSTLSSLLVITVCIVLFKIIELSPGHFKRHIRITAGALLMAAVLLIGANWIVGVKQTKERSAHLHEVKRCAHEATSEQDPCLLKLYPDQHKVWPRVQYLRSIHWGGL